ncbi:thioredoxin family protein [Roseivirga sp. UBA838]|uniref:thioredoxin family protein n=1 Tax=Roseivirga sp. UBA838 TaxID=1947393 RepID=UPI00257DCFB5|nr:thioredoxin family protein [Roseivirga sp. UBA838]|tara:strand:- start:42960 stop:43538 length:579 start_codon:yes stop_codon:yes gene_type:complete
MINWYISLVEKTNMEMLKAILALIVIMVIFPTFITAQEKEYNVETESVSEYVDKILNGPITKEGLSKMPYKIWFNTNYKTYLVDTETLKDIRKKNLKGLRILAFMGTWCHDSNREIPRLIRVCEELGIADQLELYGVDVNKKSRLEKEKNWDIRKTPTIIFLRNGEEIGRILEEPEVSFEHSMELIINQNAN